MFLANDPWVGAAHQKDVMLLCPVFWEGELFCWVTNCLHQYDIGGITPWQLLPSRRATPSTRASCCRRSRSSKATRSAATSRRLYLRASRKPAAVALDFRAQLAGNTTARDRILR